MSDVPAPSRRAIDAARPLLRGLSSARQVFALYPAGHPNRREVLEELVGSARALHDVSTGDPVLFVARHSFYLGPTLLARESLSLFQLVRAFEHADIRSLEFTRHVDTSGLAALVQALQDGQVPAEGPVGLRVNRLEPTLAGEDAIEVRLTDLRRAYSHGLQHLREQSLRVAAGQPIDLEGAQNTVESLTDAVVRDPAHALLLTTVKSYDEYTYYHMVNVCLLSLALGNAIGLRQDQIVALGIGALLHDVGKVAIPRDVLHHVGRLSEEQWRIVQRHPVEGAGLIFGTREGMLHPAASVVLEHHSSYDLNGYPGLSGRAHPSLPARLVAVADCFDAVTAKRAYRAPATRRGALRIIESGSGRGFDPRFVRVFTRLLGLFPVGSLVELDNGDVAVVVDNSKQLARPTVMRVLDAAGDPVEPEELDLSTTDREDRHRWNVRRAVDPQTLGIDVMELLVTGDIDLATDEATQQPEGGLVHEPSHGEAPPEDYVDTHHEHPHDHDAGGRVDPDVVPPLEDPTDGGGSGP